MPEDHYLVARQVQGYEKNAGYSIAAKSIEDAEDYFVGAKEKLLDISNWGKYIIPPVVVFHLTDSHGKVYQRKAHKGDHLKIEIAGGDIISVLVQAIEYDDYPDDDRETFAMRLSPISENENGPANNATTTVVIERSRQQLTASYHGRNQEISLLGLSDGQWESLVQGLIK